MNIINKTSKKIFIISLSFWILPVIFIIVSLFINYNNILLKDHISFMYVNIYKILISNLGFYICLILLGLVHKNSRIYYFIIILLCLQELL
jgi:hypothetical protein